MSKSKTQSEHESHNAVNNPGTRQMCFDCGEPTGKCEDDSLLNNDGEPLCEECYMDYDDDGFPIEKEPSYFQVRDLAIEHLEKAASGFMEPQILRKKIEESLGKEMHPATFHSIMYGMESSGYLEYWEANIRTADKAENKNFYRLVKGI